MINYKEIEQGGLDWLELKWGKIGGTLAKGLWVKTDTLFLDILSQMLEEFEPNDGYESEDMIRGSNLEPFAIEYVEKYSGFKFTQPGWLQSEKCKLLGISPDGITEDETIAVETKCFARKKHTSILLSNEIPLENIHQCIHYFTVNPKLKKLYWCAFRTESVKNFVKELDLNSPVNVGTLSKPYILTIEAARDYALEFAKELEIKVDKAINELKF